MSDAPRQIQNVSVEARGIRRGFNGVTVLDGIDFRVEPGEIFVLMGPSGSGKTVLLKHLIGLETAESGEILIQNEPINAVGLRDKYRMAMVFQSSALLTSMTVGENVGIYLTEHQLKSPPEIAAIVARTLKTVGLAGQENRFPNELSGGMQKRVAIARALVIEPQLILFDEPTAELDPLMAVAIGEEILKLKNQLHATSIVVTHDRDLAFGIADRIAMMMGGKILFVGTPEELKKNPNPKIQNFIYAELLIRRYQNHERIA
jgi:phospholipid/cholesterol/gamma-HCH transport system ATP-binding protein